MSASVSNPITFTGNNLNITIFIGDERHHSWMAFACWYSIKKHLPDATVTYLSPHRLDPYGFIWTSRTHVKRLFKLPTGPTLLMPPNVMAVSGMSEKLASKLQKTKTGQCSSLLFYRSKPHFDTKVDLAGLCTTKDDDCPFREYTNIGKFQLDEWVKKETSAPFWDVDRFLSEDIGINERKIFEMWKQMISVYCRLCNHDIDATKSK